MKNVMRRTVAFMLMACLLLSVMAPVTFAETTVPNPDAPTLVDGVYQYDISYSITYTQNDGSGKVYVNSSTKYINGNGYKIGDFVYHAHSGSVIMPGVGTDVTLNKLPGKDSVYKNNAWYALDFYVPAAGEYKVDILAGITNNASKDMKFYFVSSTDLPRVNATSITSFTPKFTTSLTGTGGRKTYELGNVTFETAGYYTIIMQATSGVSAVYDFYGMNLTPNVEVASDIAKLETKYDFFGMASTVSKKGDLYPLPTETLTGYYEAGKTNFDYYASSSGLTAHLENQNINDGNGGLRANAVARQWVAMTIGNPGAGTYTVSYGDVAANINFTKKLETYIVKKSVLEAKLAELQNTDPDKTIVDAVSALLNSGTLTAAASKDMHDNKNAVWGEFTFEGTDEYVAIFYAAQNRDGGSTGTRGAWIRVPSLNLTQVHTDLNTAVAASNAFSTITLIDDVNMDGAALNIATGATLDLAGYDLDANLNITSGSLVDSSKGAGSVSKVTNVAADNGSVLIKEGDVVRAYNYVAKQGGYKVSATNENTYEFWFDADFDETVYAKLTVENGFTVGAELKLNGEVVAIVDMDAKVQEWIAKKGLTASGENAGLGVEITGMETLKEGDTVTVTPVLRDAYGTSAFGGAITYTAAPAAE